MLTLTRAPEVTLSAGLPQLPGRLPTRKSAQTSALGSLKGKKSLSCSERPVPLGRRGFQTHTPGSRTRLAVQGRGWCRSPLGAGHHRRVRPPPRSRPSPVPHPPPSFPNFCSSPHGPRTRQQHPPRTPLSITPASPGGRHCCHRWVPQPEPVAQPQPPALSPAPRGSSRAGSSILPSDNPPSQVHPTLAAAPAAGWHSDPADWQAIGGGHRLARSGSQVADESFCRPACTRSDPAALSNTLLAGSPRPPRQAGLLCFHTVATFGRAERGVCGTRLPWYLQSRAYSPLTRLGAVSATWSLLLDFQFNLNGTSLRNSPLLCCCTGNFCPTTSPPLCPQLSYRCQTSPEPQEQRLVPSCLAVRPWGQVGDLPYPGVPTSASGATEISWGCVSAVCGCTCLRKWGCARACVCVSPVLGLTRLRAPAVQGERLHALPSMMEMCTALLRVRGTLLRRGPWVMEGQLRLGTSPALGTRTGTVSEPQRAPEPRGHGSPPARGCRALTGESQGAPS